MTSFGLRSIFLAKNTLKLITNLIWVKLSTYCLQGILDGVGDRRLEGQLAFHPPLVVFPELVVDVVVLVVDDLVPAKLVVVIAPVDLGLGIGPDLLKGSRSLSRTTTGTTSNCLPF